MTRDKASKLATLQFNSDTVFAVFGCGLAIASASFGVYMTVSGDSSSLGKSGNFTVFAQLSGHPKDGMSPHAPAKNVEDLDLTATASIPKPSHAKPEVAQDQKTAVTSTTVVPGIVLQTAGTDAAEVAIDGKLQRVRVGDLIPGAGEVLAIFPGQHPMLRTSRGLVVP